VPKKERRKRIIIIIIIRNGAKTLFGRLNYTTVVINIENIVQSDWFI
jgi:type IV secretory pathway VirB2 component (pilin)